MSAGNLLLVKCSQTLSGWIKKSSLLCFCNFLCQLYLRICFCLKRAKPWLELVFNQYSINTAWDLSREHWWDLIIFESILFFREFNWVSKMSKERLSVWEVWFFFVPEEIVYSLFNFLFDILWNSIYLNYVPKFG